MDWATILKEYPALVAAVSALLIAILGFLFNRWNSTHNKNLEIQKKEYDRRASIYDLRIKEAREYVDLWHHLIQAVREFHGILLDEPKLMVSNMETHKKKYTHLAEEIGESMQKNATSISILNDPELGRLNQELSLLMYPKITSQVEVIKKFVLENTYNIKDTTIKALEVSEEADKLIIKMKIRLDKLAQKVP